MILIVQFPRGLRNFIYSPEKPVVVVFPFPSILVHGECNSTFLTSFNLFSRIIWFTHFVRADSALAFVGQNHSQSHLFHLVFVYRPVATRKFFHLLFETSAFVSLSSLSPPFYVCSKTKRKFGWSETKKLIPFSSF